MPLSVEARDPELDTVALVLLDTGQQIDRWESYSFDSNYLTPSDAWHFTIGGEVSDAELAPFTVGAEVALKINDGIQATGYLDSIDIQNDRRSGTKFHFTGRDTLGYIVDSCVDPRTVLKDSQTLEELLIKLFEPFGIIVLTPTNEDNRAALTGAAKGGQGVKTSKKGKPLKSYVLHQTKPYPHEGVFQFAARVCQRHGLYIQPSFDGSGVVVGKPNFAQDAIYRLRRKRGADGTQNNIIAGGVTRDGTNQPSVILASGFGGGGEFAKATIRAAAVNPFVEADVSAVINAWPKLQMLPLGDEAAQIGGPNFVPVSFVSKRARPLYLYDDCAQTQEQIENYVRREMSLRMRQALTARYTVAGHLCNGAVWSVDTIVLVDDDIGRLREPMWILGRTFEKSRKGGTVTHLELIRPGSLVF